ncbi:rod shape-determining protein MreC [Candidatus Avelusimicrobium faecicola]|uniref:rod shape-determining protein MreC n=1 Tax=Candidatus Avelusimicrobium faecicola TaxID=3416205 RepID=UPI003D107894
MSYPKKKKHQAAQAGKSRGWMLPLFYLVLSFLLMILPLEGLVNSVKAVLSYVFIPQIRLSHSAVKYAQGVSATVQELLNAHHENRQLHQEIEAAKILSAQAEMVFAENERLTAILKLEPSKPWKGTWATIAYREPSQWNTVIIDKGAQDGIEPRSAVIAVENGVEGLAGEVVEVTENTAKVLLVRDEDFSAAAFLIPGREEGLLAGGGTGAVLLKYVPLLSQVKPGDKVYTSAASSIFPAGILAGEVSAVRRGGSFQTALTVEVAPAISSSTLKEVFVILNKDKKKK